MLAERERINRN